MMCLSQADCLIVIFLIHSSNLRYRGGSFTAVQAWRTCPLWEPSPSPFAVFYVYLCFLCFCVNRVIYVCLQYFDTVGWVFWPIKTVARITYTLLVETLNHALSIWSIQHTM